MRIRTLCLAGAVAGLVGGLAAAVYGASNDGPAVRQTGIVVTTVEDQQAASAASGGVGFTVVGDQQEAPAADDPAYASAESGPFVEESTAGCGACGVTGSCGGLACRRSHKCGGRCGGCVYCPGEPLPLFYSSTLDAMGIRFGGWVDHGVSVVANMPADRYNGVVTFNDRDAEYQMNQLWTYLEKEIDPNRFFDIGGRVDFVYGTDARFTQAIDGLEANWDQEERFYQVALPQFYLDASLADWTFRIGHFLSPLGYEGVPAVGNFFYSHAYTHQYGEPFTHTGFLLMCDFGRLSFSAGMHRGNDQFDDTDGLNALGYLGTVGWTNAADDISVNFGISATEDGPGVETVIYTLVSIFDLTDRFTWVIQHDYGSTATYGRGRARWYGLNQYLLYEINCCLAMGARIEWFRDEDGTRVRGLGDGNRAVGPFIGDFYEITFGLNWRPHSNIIVRPEIRWDWFDQDGPGEVQPFDAGDSKDQFLFGCDMIVLF
ncbi:MAG TPA: porin [Planctomycetaceae bacterium]|nr:porin [Planctomycetaceae bacterium]